MQSRLLRATQPSAHLDFTTLYDQVILAGSGSVPAVYASVVAVDGANVTVVAPSPPVSASGLHKDTLHFAVVNESGAAGLVVNGNGANINQSSTLPLPAVAGAFCQVWWSVALQQWIAFVSGGAAMGPPPTYTARGPAAPQAFTNAGFTAVGGAQVVTAPFSATQKAIITACFEVINTTVGATPTALCYLFDGVATVSANGDGTYHQDLNQGATEITEHQIVCLTTEVVGNGLARTFGVALSAATADSVTINTNLCRIVVQIVDG